MGTNKKNPRAKQPQTISDKIFTEFDTHRARNIDQSVQTQGSKRPAVMPESSPFK
ncbi:MAG TPA: hypothetical protein VNU93_00055 [Verrucomicrobiae bacterium]|nr:hypothetical protein [Verrucomicrobiae bacterium]